MGLVDGAAGLLSRRLVITTWLPLFVLLTTLVALAAGGLGWSTVADVWGAVPTDLRVLAGLALLAATAVLAHLLNAVRPQLVRLYEGYWPQRLERRYVQHHLRVHTQLKQRAAGRPWPVEYPRLARRVRCTRLGNILRAAEEHPLRQYGLPAAVVWPRLYGALPETFRVTFGAVAADFELMITISVLGLVLALTGSVLAGLLLPWYVAPSVLLAGSAIFWLGYRAAVRAAVPYANQIRAAFDVHRWRLLEAMGLRLPTSYDEERAQWSQLRKLWVGAGPDADREESLRYPSDEPPPTITLVHASPRSASEPERPPAADPPASGTPPATGTLAPPGNRTPTGTAPEAAPRAGGGSETAGAERVPRLGRDLGLSLAAAVLATATATGIWHSVRGEPTETSRALPPFHQVVTEDLSRSDKELTQRYTLKAMPAGTEVDRRSLGPKLPPGALSGRLVTTIACAKGNQVLVRRGDRATIRWTPAGAASARQVKDALILQLLAGDRAVVAVRPSDAGRLPTTAAAQLVRP